MFAALASPDGIGDFLYNSTNRRFDVVTAFRVFDDISDRFVVVSVKGNNLSLPEAHPKFVSQIVSAMNPGGILIVENNLQYVYMNVNGHDKLRRNNPSIEVYHNDVNGLNQIGYFEIMGRDNLIPTAQS